MNEHKFIYFPVQLNGHYSERWLAIIQNTADHKLWQTTGVYWRQISLLQTVLMLGYTLKNNLHNRAKLKKGSR